MIYQLITTDGTLHLLLWNVVTFASSQLFIECIFTLISSPLSQPPIISLIGDGGYNGVTIVVLTS